METTPWDPEGAATVLDAHGRLSDGSASPAVDVRAFYKALVGARIVEEKLAALGLPMWASASGEEAPLVAAAMIAGPHDWLYPGARDTAVAVARGIEWSDLAAQVLGHAAGLQGALPGRVASTELHIGTTTDALGLHLAIASGQAHAQKLDARGHATIALFGEGLTTTGIFHETIALAVSCDLPLVLVCRSQLWPDGAPAEAGQLGDSVSDRARTAGMWARRVDGADPLATWATIAAAMDRARAGRGPGLVEAVVTQLVHQPPPHRDPIERLRRHLEAAGSWTSTFQDVIEAETRGLFDRGLASVQAPHGKNGASRRGAGA
jgi:TPP-dependent pyruvate/acetoin dehydrogenase alpha subunit